MHGAQDTTPLPPAGGEPGSPSVQDNTLARWRHMAARLEPVIGVRGVRVLFDRALQLTGKSYPWLLLCTDQAEDADPFVHLKHCFETREAVLAAEAGLLLLTTFTNLLANLIGQPLTERLLGAAWIGHTNITEEGPHHGE